MLLRFPSGFKRLEVFLALLLTLNSCTPASTPTFFVPPTQAAQLIPITAVPVTAPVTAIPTLVIPTPTALCTNNLTFIQDLTIPDGTTVTPGESIDKQWSVSNSGTCNWDSRYRLKMISGDNMGAPKEQALYPARAGTKATLRIVFTAPQNSGTYRSAWQAYAPDGSLFGSEVYIQITVGP
jgi:hypothetical protein